MSGNEGQYEKGSWIITRIRLGWTMQKRHLSTHYAALLAAVSDVNAEHHGLLSRQSPELSRRPRAILLGRWDKSESRQAHLQHDHWELRRLAT